MPDVITALVALSLSATAPPAPNVTAQNPASVMAVLAARGEKPVMGKDLNGEPLIRTSVGGNDFRVYFFGCTKGVDCRTVQFYAKYPGAKPGFERLNEWNSRQRFGRAYVSARGEASIEMDLNLDKGGISQALFADNLQYWLMVMVQYKRFVAQP